LDEPKATCHVHVYDDGTRTAQLLNDGPLQITAHARLLGHSVLHRSTGRLEPEMFQSSKLCTRPSGQLLAGRKPEHMNEAVMPNDVIRDDASQGKMYKHCIYTHTNTNTQQTYTYITMKLAFLSCNLIACSTNRNLDTPKQI